MSGGSDKTERLGRALDVLDGQIADRELRPALGSLHADRNEPAGGAPLVVGGEPAAPPAGRVEQQARRPALRGHPDPVADPVLRPREMRARRVSRRRPPGIGRRRDVPDEQTDQRDRGSGDAEPPLDVGRGGRAVCAWRSQHPEDHDLVGLAVATRAGSPNGVGDLEAERRRGHGGSAPTTRSLPAAVLDREVDRAAHAGKLAHSAAHRWTSSDGPTGREGAAAARASARGWRSRRARGAEGGRGSSRAAARPRRAPCCPAFLAA